MIHVHQMLLVLERHQRLASTLDSAALQALDHSPDATYLDHIRHEQVVILGTTLSYLLLIAGSLATICQLA
jgi:hypothetical protein